MEDTDPTAQSSDAHGKEEVPSTSWAATHYHHPANVLRLGRLGHKTHDDDRKVLVEP